MNKRKVLGIAVGTAGVAIAAKVAHSWSRKSSVEKAESCERMCNKLWLKADDIYEKQAGCRNKLLKAGGDLVVEGLMFTSEALLTLADKHRGESAECYKFFCEEYAQQRGCDGAAEAEPDCAYSASNHEPEVPAGEVEEPAQSAAESQSPEEPEEPEGAQETTKAEQTKEADSTKKATSAKKSTGTKKTDGTKKSTSAKKTAGTKQTKKSTSSKAPKKTPGGNNKDSSGLEDGTQEAQEHAEAQEHTEDVNEQTGVAFGGGAEPERALEVDQDSEDTTVVLFLAGTGLGHVSPRRIVMNTHKSAKDVQDKLVDMVENASDVVDEADWSHGEELSVYVSLGNTGVYRRVRFKDIESRDKFVAELMSKDFSY